MAEESSGYVRGLITGVLVGAATALILAPKRGDEIRQDLSEGASKVKERAADLTGTVAGTAREWKDRGQDLVSSARSKAGAVSEDAADYATDVAENGQAKAHDVIESV